MVYHMRETEASIAMHARRYCFRRSNLFVNLSSKLERPLMELLARETLAEGSVDMISKIFDQNLEFVSLEHRLFSLDRPGSYVQYNDPTCPDAQVEGRFRFTHLESNLRAYIAAITEVCVVEKYLVSD